MLFFRNVSSVGKYLVPPAYFIASVLTLLNLLCFVIIFGCLSSSFLHPIQRCLGLLDSALRINHRSFCFLNCDTILGFRQIIVTLMDPYSQYCTGVYIVAKLMKIRFSLKWLGAVPNSSSCLSAVLRTVPSLKGVCHEIFDLQFFYDSNPSGPLINRLKYFRIRFRFRRDIRSQS